MCAGSKFLQQQLQMPPVTLHEMAQCWAATGQNDNLLMKIAAMMIMNDDEQ
jgi:hypothetical protein